MAETRMDRGGDTDDRGVSEERVGAWAKGAWLTRTLGVDARGAWPRSAWAVATRTMGCERRARGQRWATRTLVDEGRVVKERMGGGVTRTMGA